MMSLASSATVKQQQLSREHFLFAAKGAAAVKETALLVTSRSKATELANLCRALHTLAQKYVPNTPQSFCDFDSLLQVTNALRKLGVQVSLSAKIKAAAGTTDNAAVLNSPEYRNLRNKAIAALATIADFTGKNTPPGNLDYQDGVREGYRRASDIAILFLEDIQAGVA